MRIGIDIGGVIMETGNEGLFFTENFLMVKQNPFAFFSVMLLNLAEHEVFIISKAAPKNVERTQLWLETHDFFERTGTDPNRLVFCRERRQKAQIASLLELDVMIDDREDICRSMETVNIAAIRFDNWFETLDMLGDIDYAKSVLA